MYVYIIKCIDDTLYTGYTTDLARRMKRHNDGLASKYTRGRTPVELVYYEVLGTKSDAMKREIAIKKLSKSKKLELINGFDEKSIGI